MHMYRNNSRLLDKKIFAMHHGDRRADVCEQTAKYRGDVTALSLHHVKRQYMIARRASDGLMSNQE